MPVKNKHTQYCRTQAACDGDILQGPCIEKGTCGKCLKYLEKRGKTVAPRGINSALPPEIRRLEQT